MAYNWDGLMEEENRGREFRAPSSGQQIHRAAAAGPAGYGRADSEPEKRVLFGDDINKAPVPEATASYSQQPRVIFQSPDHKRFGMSEKIMSKHIMALGGIGAGKTNACYYVTEGILNGMTDQDILIIFDTKGDFFEKFYQRRNPRHIVIGNSPQYESISRYWDISGELEDTNGQFTINSELTAKEISKQLFNGRESESQPFFSDAAADMVAKTFCDFMRRYRNNRKCFTNEELVKYFRCAAIKEYYDLTIRNPDFRSAQLYFGDPNKPMTAQALGVFGYINTMVNDLFVGIFAEKRNTQPFSMRRLVREKGGKVIFIEYDLSVGQVLGPIYGLLIDLALKEALGRSSGAKGNVYMMIDEMKQLPKMPHFGDGLNFGRSLGVKICAGLQSINQLYETYGEYGGKTLAAGFMNSFCFQTWDYETREYVSKRFGKNYQNISFRSMNEPINVQREGYTVEDWDIMNLNVGEAFINLVGERPFKFRFSNYEETH